MILVASKSKVERRVGRGVRPGKVRVKRERLEDWARAGVAKSVAWLGVVSASAVAL